LTVLLCCLLLAGCGASDTPEITAPSLPEPALTTAATEAPAPETVPATETEAATEAPAETEAEAPETTEAPLTPEEQARLDFYEVFWELDPEETDAWLEANPAYFEKGYWGISVNQAWLSDNGLDLYTTEGHQVLAIDAENRILIIRAWLNKSRTVMAIAKDPSRLHLCPSKDLGRMGEKIGSIAARNDGLLAMTGSGFLDPGGNGNGGQIAGYCMCGKDFEAGKPFGWNYARFELREDNRALVTHADGPCTDATTDAMEFEPALLIDGEYQDPGIWTGENPRTCIGQTWRKEILMLGVEGRFSDSPGCSVLECAKLMKAYGGENAINVDGGTTAIVWYRGQPIMRCSNLNSPDGRYLPNAWVYTAQSEDENAG
jgi:exopolysaccharide biosynthesis protein